MSESTVLDRRVIWRANWVLKFIFPVGSVPVGVYPIQYGVTDALAPFPNHALTTVQSITINNNSVSMNVNDVLPALMRFVDKRHVMRYNGMCPNMYDTYGQYSDAVGAVNNPLGAYRNIGDNDLPPRGAFPINWVSGSQDGSTIQPISSNAGGGANNDTALTVYVSFTSNEPLIVPPFIWGEPETNNMGFYGIQNINAVFNVNNCSRVWRSANSWAGLATITVDSTSGNTLLFNQLTPHPSDLMPSRNVVPYATFPRYITPVTQTFPSLVTVNAAGVVQLNPSDAGSTISSTSIQLNSIPDKLIILVRKQLSQQNPNDTDFFLPIRKISINFNNHSGILSTSSPQDLYRYSVEAGSNQSWEEFYGEACVANPNPKTGTAVVPTTGSLLVLDFAKHINIVEDYYSPCSLGQFQVQFNVGVANQFAPGTPQQVNQNWELVMITVNSGLFVCERGTASSYQGILTRSDVLEVSTQEAYSSSEYRRMVGGGFLDSLKSVAGKILPKLPALASIAKTGLSMFDNPLAQAASKGIGALGYGRSGGGTSGGGGSGGGRRHKLESKLMS